MEKQKEKFDYGKKETELKIGDKVLLKNQIKTGKLTTNWKGPYFVHEVFGKGAYKIRTIDGNVLKATQNVKNLKKYYE